MALSQGSTAVWSDIDAIYNTLRFVQNKHGLSLTSKPAAAGSTIHATDISRLNNAINALNSEKHITMSTGVTNPSAGGLIYPGIITTLRTKIGGVTATCHNDSFRSFTCYTCDWQDTCFSW